MSLRFPTGLYGITPDWPDTGRLLAAVAEARAGGMAALQWRRKTGDPAARKAQLQALSELCRGLGLPLIVNDDWRLAADVGADGVHLGREDGSPRQAREALGQGPLIGCSCYDQPALAARHLRDGADYVAFGSMYPSTVKPGAVRATLDHIRQGRQLAGTGGQRAAIVAIGGLTAANAAPVVAAGADAIAVISALFEAPDVRSAAAALAALYR